MKIILAAVILAAAACSRKPVPVASAPAAHEPNTVERYGQGLANDVKRADEARDKANAAIQKTDDAQKAMQEAESH